MRARARWSGVSHSSGRYSCAPRNQPRTPVHNATVGATWRFAILPGGSQGTSRSIRAVAVWSTTAQHRTKRWRKVQCPQFRSRAKHKRINGSDKVELRMPKPRNANTIPGTVTGSDYAGTYQDV